MVGLCKIAFWGLLATPTATSGQETAPPAALVSTSGVVGEIDIAPGLRAGQAVALDEVQLKYALARSPASVRLASARSSVGPLTHRVPSTAVVVTGAVPKVDLAPVTIEIRGTDFVQKSLLLVAGTELRILNQD